MNILERQNKELRDMVNNLVWMIDNGNFDMGVCCCGDSMESHASVKFMIDGPDPSWNMACMIPHTPRDAGEYGATSLMDEAEALLVKHEAEILSLPPVDECVDDTDYLGVYLQLKHAMERKPHAVTSRTTERAVWSAVQCLKIAHEKHGHASDITL